MIIPLPRAVWLAAAALGPAALAVFSPSLIWAAVAIDAAVLALVTIDFVRAPKAVGVTRTVAPVLSAGIANRVQLTFDGAPGVHGEFRDIVPPGPQVEGHVGAFAAGQTVTWKLTPLVRGDLPLGPVHLKLHGPWGLAARRIAVPAVAAVKVYPDLTALLRDALQLQRARDDDARRVVRRPNEGREFESLREYRPGDDRRSLDGRRPHGARSRWCACASPNGTSRCC